MSGHKNQYTNKAQKRVGSNTRGAKHQQLVDRDCKSISTNVCTVWMDDKKASDLMPHTWTLDCLKVYKISRTPTAFIQNSMRLWKTTLAANSEPVAQVSIKCGVYLGHALSPLLFYLNPLSQINNKSSYWYKL